MMAKDGDSFDVSERREVLLIDKIIRNISDQEKRVMKEFLEDKSFEGQSDYYLAKYLRLAYRNAGLYVEESACFMQLKYSDSIFKDASLVESDSDSNSNSNNDTVSKSSNDTVSINETSDDNENRRRWSQEEDTILKYVVKNHHFNTSQLLTKISTELEKHGFYRSLCSCNNRRHRIYKEMLKKTKISSAEFKKLNNLIKSIRTNNKNETNVKVKMMTNISLLTTTENVVKNIRESLLPFVNSIL